MFTCGETQNERERQTEEIADRGIRLLVGDQNQQEVRPERHDESERCEHGEDCNDALKQNFRYHLSPHSSDAVRLGLFAEECGQATRNLDLNAAEL